jgi:lipopolysaccharide export system protein LptC
MDSYSRLVAWLKVLLPLMALGLLSTLFLLSRNVDSTAAIPFAEKEIQDRMRDQQVTGPFFSGATGNGDLISFSANKVGKGALGTTHAEGVTAQIDLPSGSRISFSADFGDVNMTEQTSKLTGNVQITTSAGYVVMTELLTSSLKQLDVKSPDMVEGSGPIGQITAGSLHISSLHNNGPAQLIFTNRVKLIYDPQRQRD